jgi:putative protease
MAIHNRAGIRGAEKLGLSRVVLSRELTCEEIGNIKRETALQLEVFIHGALCYSISGMCLASSFLGGASGNRGMSPRCAGVNSSRNRPKVIFSHLMISVQSIIYFI